MKLMMKMMMMVRFSSMARILYDISQVVMMMKMKIMMMVMMIMMKLVMKMIMMVRFSSMTSILCDSECENFGGIGDNDFDDGDDYDDDDL